MDDQTLLTPQQIGTDCVCLNTQRAARALARRYDAALRPIELTSGQFAILAGLNQEGSASIGALADGLGLERTTLTRNLLPLEADGLIRSAPGDGDKRVRGLTLTAQGRAKLALAMPLWRAAQADTIDRLAPHGWADIRPALDQLASI
ncbi:MarR family winged helix-turn-helix transcriptional regulator [Sphingomonas sp. 28-62-11]|uniref:MarR family winged helix-turn-helix transcriptional regulator n=1 Tax=Sphingomonas sp. 28-62-11 TaxID=1970432 RepID=UPI000BDCD94B|nr:MAG: hypothetical protein B7Y49_00320 [Sphingomonas sp. 28-62-11]